MVKRKKKTEKKPKMGKKMDLKVQIFPQRGEKCVKNSKKKPQKTEPQIPQNSRNFPQIAKPYKRAENPL